MFKITKSKVLVLRIVIFILISILCFFYLDTLFPKPRTFQKSSPKKESTFIEDIKENEESILLTGSAVKPNEGKTIIYSIQE